MRHKLFAGLLLLFFCIGATPMQEKYDRFLSFVTDPSSIKLYWKDDQGQILRSIQNLKRFTESKNQKLKFAMNGGMYMTDNSPQGLFIDSGTVVVRLNTLSGNGNFHLKPNGVFYLTRENKAVVC